MIPMSGRPCTPMARPGMARDGRNRDQVWPDMSAMHPQRFVHRLQAITGVTFAFFLCLHLATTICAARSTKDYDAVLEMLRPFYRPHVLVEVLLMGIPATVHIGCAVYNLVYRYRRGGSGGGGRARVHRIAGYVLLLAIVGHVAATRVIPTFGEGATATGRADFSFLAYSLVNWPWFFVPYYFALGIAGAVHLWLGLGY